MAAAQDTWDGLWADITSFFKAVSRNKAVNINASKLHKQGREIVIRYFRQERPKLLALGVKPDTIDAPMQDLMRLMNGNNAKASYLATLKQLRKQRPKIDAEREILLGVLSAREPEAAFTSTTEVAIFETLEKLISTAAASYHQALQDLQEPDRTSWRGTSDELRETVREVLDHLAPDGEVMKVEGFALEKNRDRPTMSQKARFILKSRGTPSGAISSAQDAANRIEEGAANLARSVYTRGSIASHTTATRDEVKRVKLYVDALLTDLLAI